MYVFFKKILLSFREGKGGRKKGREILNVVASHMILTGDLTCNPGMCPNRELNQQPCGLQPTPNPLSYTSQGLSWIFFKGDGKKFDPKHFLIVSLNIFLKFDSFT